MMIDELIRIVRSEGHRIGGSHERLETRSSLRNRAVSAGNYALVSFLDSDPDLPLSRLVWVCPLDDVARVASLVGHRAALNAVAITTANHTAITTSDDHTAMVWDLHTGQPRHTLTGHADRVTHVAITTDNHTAITTSHDHTAIIWDLTTG